MGLLRFDDLPIVLKDDPLITVAQLEGGLTRVFILGQVIGCEGVTRTIRRPLFDPRGFAR